VGKRGAAGTSNLAIDDYIMHNINFPRNVLGIKLPPF